MFELAQDACELECRQSAPIDIHQSKMYFLYNNNNNGASYKATNKKLFLLLTNCLQFHFRSHTWTAETGHRAASEKARITARNSGESSETLIARTGCIDEGVKIGWWWCIHICECKHSRISGIPMSNPSVLCTGKFVYFNVERTNRVRELMSEIFSGLLTIDMGVGGVESTQQKYFYLLHRFIFQ